MTAQVTFTPAQKPDGIVTVEISETEALAFIGYRPATFSREGSTAHEYSKVRDSIWYGIQNALRLR